MTSPRVSVRLGDCAGAGGLVAASSPSGAQPEALVSLELARPSSQQAVLAI